MNKNGPPVIKISSGSLELLKLLAVLLMTLDHVNKYLFNGTLTGFYEGGRLAMPLFVFVLMYNSARPRQDYLKISKRLFVSGIISTPAFIALGGLYDGWWPLNIFFTLFIAVVVTWSIEDKRYATAVIFFFVGGGVVEFWWPALLFAIGCWFYCRCPNWIAAACCLVGLGLLVPINQNLWAFTALFIILWASRISIALPRLKWFFYVYYPVHLAVILIVKYEMSKVGYLFFY